MSNPQWKAGMKAVNPAGRPKHSARNVKEMVERFIKRNTSFNEMQKMYNVLNEKEKLIMLTELMPFTIPKETSIGAMSATDIDRLQDDLMTAIQKQTQV